MTTGAEQAMHKIFKYIDISLCNNHHGNGSSAIIGGGRWKEREEEEEGPEGVWDHQSCGPDIVQKLEQQKPQMGNPIVLNLTLNSVHYHYTRPFVFIRGIVIHVTPTDHIYSPDVYQ